MIPITILFSTFNDEVVIPHTVKWYRERFSNCRIVVFDNYSTDTSAELARSLGCEVYFFKSGDRIPFEVGTWFKNNIWKTATTDWVMLVDADEFLDLSESDLLQEQAKGVSVIKSIGYTVVNMKEDFDIENMNYGVPNPWYDKSVCWDKSKIKEMNYGMAGHLCNPEGEVKFSDRAYNMLHKSHINTSFVIEKYERNWNRIDEEHKRKGYGVHYNVTKSDVIKMMQELRNKAKILLKK